jgi:hypothetical protein
MKFTAKTITTIDQVAISRPSRNLPTWKGAYYLSREEHLEELRLREVQETEDCLNLKIMVWKYRRIITRSSKSLILYDRVSYHEPDAAPEDEKGLNVEKLSFRQRASRLLHKGDIMAVKSLLFDYFAQGPSDNITPSPLFMAKKTLISLEKHGRRDVVSLVSLSFLPV